VQENFAFVAQIKNAEEEAALLKWFNEHLEAAGSDRRVTNFGPDLQDSEAYSTLLHQLQPDKCDEVKEDDPNDRAAHVIDNAKKMGVPATIQPKDINKPNPSVRIPNITFI
jgi:hypothetical protein